LYLKNEPDDIAWREPEFLILKDRIAHIIRTVIDRVQVAG